ncbi:Imo32 protein [Starmerella bacillaris]|uniref:Imo32 protein n=1 Tax=Starmerella bacillaris TaxID=1247836 RepID=A0AAV5RPE1_STABA|nr:Imo32 protein [Starmerella bacillaris]
MKLLRRAFSTGALDMAYEMHGSKTASRSIVFLHGLFGSKRTNRSVARSLAQKVDARIFCVDQRNHGDSPHSDVHNYAAMAADTALFIKKHGLEQPLLIGHSMGAKTALATSLLNPQLVSAVVSVDNSAVKKPLGAGFEEYIAGMQVADAAGPRSQQELRSILEPYGETTPVTEYLSSTFAKDKDGVYRCTLNLNTLSDSLPDIAGFDDCLENKQFVKPLLLIRATQSHFVPDSAVETTRKMFPNLQCVDIDAGHWLISEKPHEFVRICVDFVRSLKDF